jgi:isoquinoline 1-oxidoreductase beta subunit
MIRKKSIQRREFLKKTVLSSTGLVLGFYLPVKANKHTGNVKNQISFHTPNAFINIGTDETIKIVVNHSEMGQGIYTSLCQIIAEELDVDWKNVEAIHAPISSEFNHTVYPIQLTAVSSSVRSEWDRLRNVGASARQMLLSAAAQEWNIDIELLKSENGVVKHGTKTLTYGQLAERASKLTTPKSVKLKDKKDFKYIGKPMPRLDTPQKINGEAKFGLDVSIPGMLVTVVIRPPRIGSKVITFDAKPAMALDGVKHVFLIDTGIAVVADGFWAAKKGSEAVKVEWDSGHNSTLSSDEQLVRYETLMKTDGAVAENEGDVKTAFEQAEQIIESTYELPYLAHSPMEPLNCLADVKDNHCTLYFGTQTLTVEAGAVATALDIPFENVKIELQYLGGGFGRRATVDGHSAVEAAIISKKAKAPVKLIWLREDDVKGGYYRPRTLTSIKGSLDTDNNFSGFNAKIVSESIVKGTPWESAIIIDGVERIAVEGLAESSYHVPNVHIEWIDGNTPSISTLWWRSVGHSLNGFIMETFIDELAEAAGRDEYEFRKALLKDDPRSLDALNLAITKSPWRQKLPSGHALGLAVHTCFDTAVAYVAEVSMNNNWPKVHRVWAGVDCGPYINPDTIKAQIEGSVVFGLTAAFYGEISFEGGSIVQSNFHDYKMLRIHETPEVETHIVESNKKMGGIGEPGVPPIAPAVANAIYKLTGQRIYKLPFTKNDFLNS